MQTIAKSTMIAVLAVASGMAVAQSSVQCEVGSNGQLEAALVWRNTLGAERANALCRTAAVRTPVLPPAVAMSAVGAANVQSSNSLEYTPVYSAQAIPQVQVGSAAGYTALGYNAPASSATEEFVPMFSVR